MSIVGQKNQSDIQKHVRGFLAEQTNTKLLFLS